MFGDKRFVVFSGLSRVIFDISYFVELGRL